jgi:hypothetical protein
VEQRFSEVSLPPPRDHLLTLVLSNNAWVTRLDGPTARRAWRRAGDYGLVPAGHSYGWRPEGKLELLHLFISPDLVDEAAVDAGLDPARVRLHDCLSKADPLIAQLALRLLSELNSPQLASRLYVEAIAQQISVHLLSNRLSGQAE